jgi:hypothetical protein
MLLLTLAERPPVVIDLCEMVWFGPLAIGTYLLARYFIKCL